MKNNIPVNGASNSLQNSSLKPFKYIKSWVLSKNYILLMLIASAALLSACTAQSRLLSRLKTEWNIVEYEVRNNDGSGTTIENAGTITFNSNGQGSQSFTTSITHTGQTADSQFNWENTANTVTIRTTDNQQPRVWIVVNSSRTSQEWYSTDSAGNVQVMKLERK